MQHSKSYILSQDTKRALDYLYKEIEALERKIKQLENELNNLDI